MEFINNRDSKFLVNIHPVRKICQDLLLDKSTKDYDYAILKLILEELHDRNLLWSDVENEEEKTS